MPAAIVFTFQQINPNETVGLFVHGYGERESVNFSIVPHLRSNVPPVPSKLRRSCPKEQPFAMSTALSPATSQ